MSREYHVSRRGAALPVIPSSLLCVLLWYTIPLILNLPCYQGYSLSIVPLLPRNNVVYITNRVSSSTSTTSMDRRRNHARYRVSRTMASFSKKEMTIPTTVPSFNSISSFIGKSTSTLVSLLCFATLAYKRNATMVSFFLGSIVNAVVAKVLKRIIKQQRPETTDPHDDDDDGTSTIRPTDNGMPSSHSMSLGFIGTFTYLGWGKKHSIVAPILLIYIITSLFYRVQAKLHTKEQVYVGVLFGALNGYMWHQFTFGFWPFSTNFNSIISNKLLPPSGIFPPQYLILPAFVGLAVVGSFERRISRWMKKKKVETQTQKYD